MGLVPNDQVERNVARPCASLDKPREHRINAGYLRSSAVMRFLAGHYHAMLDRWFLVEGIRRILHEPATMNGEQAPASLVCVRLPIRLRAKNPFRYAGFADASLGAHNHAAVVPQRGARAVSQVVLVRV